MSFVDPNLIPSTGNPAIDGHHRRIAGKVNSLFDGWKTGWAADSLTELLDEIFNDIQDHFIAEKFLTRGAGYEGWERHEPLHGDLVASIDRIRTAVRVEAEHTGGMLEAFRFFEELIFAHEFDGDQDFWPVFSAKTANIGDSALIEWPEETHIGDEEIDRQHALLVTKLNAVNQALSASNTIETLRHLLSLRQAARHHFIHEENLMRDTGHPDLKEHMAAHRILLRDLDEACRQCRALECDRLRDFLSRGLKFWFVDHVNQWDDRLG